MKVSLGLTGTKRMLQHNGRLANPLDEHTRQLKALTAKRKKTDQDLVDIMLIEARGACWETTEGLLGIPTGAVWRCVYDAAKAFKLGEDIKRSLSFEDTTEPIEMDGSVVSCDEWLKSPDHIDYRPVKVMGRKVMRARPIIQAGWVATFHFDLLEDVIDPRDLGPILERAGRLVGLGDWRPIYGTFSTEVAV